MKKIFALLVFGFIGVVLVFGLLNTAPSQESPVGETSPKIETAMVVVQFDDNNTVANEIQVQDNTTAYSLLETLAEDMGLEVRAQQYPFGVFVEAINEYEGSAEKAWIYFVDGKSGNVAANEQVVSGGSTVEWKYISPNE